MCVVVDGYGRGLRFRGGIGGRRREVGGVGEGRRAGVEVGEEMEEQDEDE